MGFDAPTIQRLTGGRLHLSHGPMDVVLKAWGDEAAVAAAERAAAARFGGILGELCAELDALRRPVDGGAEEPVSPVGLRMARAVRPFAPAFITPMAAVAGAVADELMAALRSVPGIERAFVNDGGDIAVWCGPGTALDVAVAADFGEWPEREAYDRAVPGLNGLVRVTAGDGVGGIATSGARGRSFSLGIADSVTVLAADAAAADAAATMIANAVDADDPAVVRRPARSLDPDSDLGERLVTVSVGPLSARTRAAALEHGAAVAGALMRRGLVIAAFLSLQGETRVVADATLDRVASARPTAIERRKRIA
ncbi:UPF0280 family protein [Chthonobacter albigriseus]|uniref:UPF0280 family protein n=1 Tax=Chthonobacter albigriseus TaxID=1683161 RepID=UPI0015EFAB43|nr:UPF0280 family protein [Chthonobacter albigriseus]